MAHILVMDDDSSVRTALCIMLTYDGHTVAEAVDGEEGVQIYHRIQPDLVIIDIIMPRKDGLEVIQELKGKNPTVKIIAIAGQQHLLSQAQVLGADLMIEKPPQMRELLEGVKALLKKNE